MAKQTPITREFIGKDGKAVQNEYKTYRITDIGKSYVDNVLNKEIQ